MLLYALSNLTSVNVLSPSATETGTPPILDNQASSYRRAVKVGAVEWLLTSLILFLIGASFLPVLKNNFVDWDDKILLSTKYQDLDWTAVRSILTDFVPGLYQPLSWMTIAFDEAFWWRDPFGYHLTSLLIHCASAIIFFFVTQKLLAAIRSDQPHADDATQNIPAFVATLIFALHPLRVEAVASAGARDDVLSGLFFLLSILCYLQTDRFREAPFWRGWTTPSLIFYALSLLSRPTAVTLPVVLLFLDFFVLRRRLPGTPQQWFGLQSGGILWRKFPFFILAVGSVLVTLFTGQQGEPASAEGYPSVRKRFLYLLVAPAFYLWKTILPLDLSPIYELTTVFEILAMLMTAAITLGVFVVRRRWPALLPIWFAYLVMLLGVMAIAAVDSQLLADRQTYLPSLPLAVSAGLGLFHIRHMLRSGSARRTSVTLGCGVAAVIGLGLGYLTWEQTQVWQNSEQLWTHAIAVSRSSGAHKHLAARLEAEGRDEEAIEHYRRAIPLGRSDWNTHYKLGLLLQGQSRIQEAIEHYRAAAHSNPAAAEAHNQLAFALLSQGKSKEAAEHFEKVLELTSAATHSSMHPKRAKHFRKVYELDPDRGEAHFRLGGIAALQGEYDKAVDHFQHAIKVSPDFADAFLNLGLVRAAQGDLDAAVVSFRKAVDIRPTYAQAHESLGRALAEQGRKEEAAKHLQEAIRLLKLSPAPR